MKLSCAAHSEDHCHEQKMQREGDKKNRSITELKFIALLRCQLLHKKAKLQLGFSLAFNYLCFWTLFIGNSIYSLKLLFSWISHLYLSLHIYIYFFFFSPAFWCGYWEGLVLWCSPARTAATVVLPFYLPLFCSWLFHNVSSCRFLFTGFILLEFLFVCLIGLEAFPYTKGLKAFHL